jgi:hypothetical protein
MGRFKDGVRSLSHAWNAFINLDKEVTDQFNYGAASYGMRPDRTRVSFSNERSIISSILTRLSVDVAAVDIRHVRLDSDGRYLEDIKSGINNCLTVEANIDQGATHFRQDIAMSLFDQGAIAVVPVDTTLNPALSAGFDIKTMRVAGIKTWHPSKVRVEIYNERTGRREEITVDKETTAVVENPFYNVMNEQNSTLQRLIRKLNLLDAVDEASSSGKLDMIIQLPYVIKSEARRQQAEQRRRDIEFQLTGSKYGIAYTDGTEKITQLNRPVENNLLKQIEFLTDMLYGQLGLTKEIMDGSADEKTMINYNNRTIAPVVVAIVEAMRRTFLSKTARAQNQSIQWFRDPFKLLPLSEFADVADKLSRNEVTSSNELRQAIGLKPSKDPRADELRNSNMPVPSAPPATNKEGDGQNGSNRPQDEA